MTAAVTATTYYNTLRDAREVAKLTAQAQNLARSTMAAAAVALVDYIRDHYPAVATLVGDLSRRHTVNLAGAKAKILEPIAVLDADGNRIREDAAVLADENVRQLLSMIPLGMYGMSPAPVMGALPGWKMPILPVTDAHEYALRTYLGR